MVYMGSKRRYAPDITAIINKYIKENNIKNFYDVFCGGANLTDKIQCENIYASDLCPELIALHIAAQENFSQIPEDGSREMWDKYYTLWKEWKKSNFSKETTPNTPLYEMGAIEWYASFSNGGWTRGYAKNSATRNYYQEAYRNHKKQAEDENYKKIIFSNNNYLNVDFKENSVCYCDSPYKSTKPYPVNPKFNFEEYYNWLRETSKKIPIFVSEQSLPEEFDQYKIWEKATKRTVNKTNDFEAVEKLWFIDRRDTDA